MILGSLSFYQCEKEEGSIYELRRFPYHVLANFFGLVELLMEIQELTK